MTDNGKWRTPVTSWRNRPRKPVSEYRCCRVSVRVTKEEQAAIRESARRAGMLFCDYVVCKALDKEDRTQKQRRKKC